MTIINKDWLNRCKISDAIIEDFNIHDTIIGDDTFITFPVHDIDGTFLFNKYRRNPLDDRKPKYTYDRGGKVTLYGAHLISDKKTILITEGEKDCLVAWSANIPAVTSTGGALSFQKDWASLFTNKEVIICFDNDEAGGNGMVKTLEYIPHAKVLFLPDRPGIKDISDYVENGGNLHDLMKTAKYLPSLEVVKENRTDRIAIYQSTHFHDAYIRKHEQPIIIKRPINSMLKDKLLRAKLHPITNFVQFTHNKLCCPFHAEKTPSLVYYPNTNTCYCFGQCGKVYDSIDMYIKLNNCSFNQAIQELQ